MAEIDEIEVSDPANIEEIVARDLQEAKIGLLSGFSPLTPSAASPADALARVLRFRWLGLTSQNAAKAAGVSEGRLRQWTDEDPTIGEALEAALSLSIADAAAKLRALMLRDDSTGLGAVRFFLEARADEFNRKAKLEVSVQTGGDIIDTIRRDIYGIDDGDGDAETDLPAAALSEASLPGPCAVDRLGQDSAGGWLDGLDA